ncbi:RNA polymerase sigma-70 factor [Planctopirus limnophila DSM 3776]|uniref:RNA polymerase sigma-70 factor n=2 Tax=Planctopirus TaxID=1649480 RepID=D5SV26_PLAL2|nr:MULTISPECIES: sigma-70 family RNA polymerase sigma factor [Planctopirus]ADG69312.1 RNA polymerase sigma-70 factor [Planctopirus limnophila DSM 3776]ODA30059.1 RNA polymerase subunit sigma-70 [Planctopirus hydrillae]
MQENTIQTDALLKNLREGNDKAVNELLERHRTPLRRMIELRLDRQMARRVDASDVVQDVFMEASGRLREYLENPRLPFHVWLRHLARDRMIDLHRRHRGALRRSMDREQALPVSQENSGDQLMDQFKDDELTPAAENIRREFEERFLLALEQLEADDREMILMRHFEQLGNNEVAEILGLTPPAAGMRHLRALRKLRNVLGEDGLSLPGT